jgi:hypothetical protein
MTYDLRDVSSYMGLQRFSANCLVSSISFLSYQGVLNYLWRNRISRSSMILLPPPPPPPSHLTGDSQQD